MSYLGERESVGAVLRDWDRCPVFWPSSRIDADLLKPSTNATAPTRYLVVTIERESERRIAARGLRQIDGSVRIWVWCEAGLGDAGVEEIADALVALFAEAPPPNGWAWMDCGLGDPERDDGWCGGQWRQDFIRFEQGPA